MSEGGNSLDESIGLITAANEVVNDPSSVGTALKTLTLRLRGSKTELEEMGEDVSDMATTTSQLQAKLLALTGGQVDIMADANTFKNSTQILREMAAAWEDMTDIQRASALELMGGKRQANVLSALIQNFDTVENVIETSANSAGSALKENERYLDSIQGKIDQFNNAMQAMWSNTLDSDVVKGFVALGTELVKIIDKIGLLNSALIALGVFSVKKYNLLGNLFGSKDDIESIQREYEKLKKKADEAVEAFKKNPNEENRVKKDSAIKNRDDYYNINFAPDIAQEEIINKQTQAQEKLEKAKTRLANAQAKEAAGHTYAASTMKKYESAVRSAEREVNGLNEELKEKVVVDKIEQETTKDKTATTWKELGAQIISGKVTKDNIGASIKNILVTKLANTALGEKIAKHYGVQVAELGTLTVTQLLTGGFTTLATAIWTALAPLLPFIAAAAAVAGTVALAVHVIDQLWVTAGEAKEKLEELNSEIDDLESDLGSLNEELKTTQERMEELLSKDSLSFTEEEELDNLRLQNEYLEKQIELQELILKNKKAARTSAAKDVIAKTWNNKDWWGKEDYQVDWDDGVIKQDNFWSIGLSGKDAINEGLNRYKQTQASIDMYEKSYQTALEKYGSEHWITKQNEDQLNKFKEQLIAQAGGINMVLGDMSNIITENELQYGDDDEINKFLDEYYAMSLKWQEAQGLVGKSGIIKSIFNSTDEDTKNLKEQLNEIAGSDLDAAAKQTEAQELIQGALDTTDESYQHLKTTVKTLGMSAEELAKSFIAVSDAPDIKTIGGVLQIFADGEEILKSSAENLQLGIDEAGKAITWDGLFSGADGEKVADNLKIAAILEGADEDVRNQFTKLVEEVENGKMSVDEALSKWKMVGADKAVEALNTEFEALNSELFPDAQDEISGLIDTLSELKSAFESVASTMDTFKGAQEEYNNTGRVSIKTALELMSTTDDWDKILNITEDSITLVDGAEKTLMESQLESIATQMQTAADMAKIKLEAAENAQKAKEAFDAEANAANNLSTTEQNVNTTQQNANITTQQRTGAMGDLAVQTYGTAISELDYAANDGTVQTAESVKAKAIGLVSASIVGLDAFIEALLDGPGGKTIGEAWGAYQEARDVVVNDANSKTTTVDQLREDYEKKQTMANVAANGGNYADFSKNWENSDKDGDGVDDDEEDKFMEDFQREMDYWENRIAANQARYEQLQNEIDLLEAKGQKADASYYDEQIKLEGERKSLLEQQRTEAKKYLTEIEAMGLEGSDEWWEIAGVLNNIESELDDVTASIVDLQDAIGEIDSYKFEEFNTRLDDIISKLGTIRDLIAPDGEEDWFDEQGDWTEEGVAVLGTYIQELETYKQGLAEAEDAYADYVKEYAGNEKYYAALGIHSEQELYDKRQELIEQQYDYAQSISDTEQSVVDMYESNIDAIEEYTDALIDSYNDYIDSVKEALEAERDLYDFKKNVQKQSKDIAAIERRIASLSGSTNASDVAERRKLEAELYDSRESLNDTYYDHARSAQDEALDSEQTAYEESMTKFVEGLRTSLETATLNMDEFLMSVTSMVTLNADTVLTKYQETELPLGDAITNPWEAAKAAVGNYSGDALALMNQWTTDGFFDNYNKVVGNGLSSPWTAGSNAAGAFKTSVDTVMEGVVSKIATNVKTASGELSKLYQQILDTEKRAAEADVTVDDDDEYVPQKLPLKSEVKAVIKDPDAPVATTIRPASPTRPTFKKVGDLWSGVGHTGVSIGKKSYNKASEIEGGDGIYYPFTNGNGYKGYIKKGEGYTVLGNGKMDIHTFKPIYQKHAKGTTGTARDEWAITDEPQFGDELVLVPGKDGNLSFMRKGTGVVPADLTANLMEWGQFTPDSMNLGGGVNVNMINNAVNKPEFNFAFDALVKAENITEETLPAVKKLVTQELNRFTKELNYALKGKGAR